MGALLCRALLPALPHGELASLSASSSPPAAVRDAAELAAASGETLEGLLPTGMGMLEGWRAPGGVASGAVVARGGLARGGRPLGEPTMYFPVGVDSARSMAGRDTVCGAEP